MNKYELHEQRMAAEGNGDRRLSILLDAAKLVATALGAAGCG